MRRASPSLSLAVVLGLLGCGAAPTGLVVVVRTDLRVPEDIAVIRAVVSDANGAPVSLNDFVLDAQGSAGPPFSFAVVPLEDDPDRKIQIDLVALDGDRALVLERRARIGFEPHRSLLLEMFLAASCRGAACDEGDTCTADGCVSDQIDTGDLVDVDPGGELE